jgi:hypothetical protein
MQNFIDRYAQAGRLTRHVRLFYTNKNTAFGAEMAFSISRLPSSLIATLKKFIPPARLTRRMANASVAIPRLRLVLALAIGGLLASGSSAGAATLSYPISASVVKAEDGYAYFRVPNFDPKLGMPTSALVIGTVTVNGTATIKNTAGPRFQNRRLDLNSLIELKHCTDPQTPQFCGGFYGAFMNFPLSGIGETHLVDIPEGTPSAPSLTEIPIVETFPINTPHYYGNLQDLVSAAPGGFIALKLTFYYTRFYLCYQIEGTSCSKVELNYSFRGNLIFNYEGCGDDRDKLIAEYDTEYTLQNGTSVVVSKVTGFKPTCADFVKASTGRTKYYTYTQLSKGDGACTAVPTYNWVMIPRALTSHLDHWIDLVELTRPTPLAIPKVNSQYRSPARNFS